MKQTKRILSVVLAVVMLIAIVPVGNVGITASAAGGVKTKLDAFIQRYPNRSRWTGSFDGGSECYGFGKLVIYNIFGKYSSSTYRSWNYLGVSTSGMTNVNSITNYSYNNVKSLLASAKTGDILQFALSGIHTMVVYGVDSDGVWIYDCNNDWDCGIRLEKVPFDQWEGRDSVKLSLLRSDNYDEIDGSSAPPAAPTYVNLGDDFWAYIVLKNGWRHLENTGSNVQIAAGGNNSRDSRQIWHFLRQSDNSYKIVSAFGGLCLDLADGNANNGANIGVCESNDTSAQRWFIFSSGDGYGIKSACGEVVLDSENASTASGNNIQAYQSNESSAQIFSIWNLDNDSVSPSSSYRKIVLNLGDNFYAYIIQKSAWKHIESTGKNVQIAAGGNDSRNPKQIWYFVRQSDGSYRVINEYDGKCLDLENGMTSDQNNVGVCLDNGEKAQRWFVFGNQDGYGLRSACGDAVLDCANGGTVEGTNIQIYTSNDSEAQIFSIYGLTQDGISYNKPAQPNAVAVSTIKQTGSNVLFSWTQSPLQSNLYDARTYDFRIWKGTDTSGATYKTILGLTGNSYEIELPAGTYTVNITAVNSKYFEWYTMGSGKTFTVTTPSCSTHTWNSGTITQAATCSATGVKTYTCTACNATKTETVAINASNHVNTTNVAATASTCTVKGYTAGVYCNDCKKYISGHAEQPLAAHQTELRNARAATCTVEGYTGDQYCTVCKQTISTGTTIGKTAHTLTTINQKNANCTEKGYTGDQYCTTCKQTITKGSATAALGHTSPDGNGNCTRCGKHIKDVTPTQPSQPQTNPNACKWCGKVHNGNFFDRIVGFFHSILAIFKR